MPFTLRTRLCVGTLYGGIGSVWHILCVYLHPRVHSHHCDCWFRSSLWWLNYICINICNLSVRSPYNKPHPGVWADTIKIPCTAAQPRPHTLLCSLTAQHLHPEVPVILHCAPSLYAAPSIAGHVGVFVFLPILCWPLSQSCCILAALIPSDPTRLCMVSVWLTACHKRPCVN